MVVDMGDGQNYLAPCYRVWLVILGPTPLAPIFSPIKTNEARSELPILWIPLAVLWAYWHRFLLVWRPPGSFVFAEDTLGYKEVPRRP